MTTLIFGAKGQDGQFLARRLEREGQPLVRVGREYEGQAFDIGDRGSVADLIADVRPTHVFHFAAASTTRHEALWENHHAISTATANILEACRLAAPDSRLFLPGSALQFRNEGRPIDEDSPFEASSPYSASRIHMAYLGRYFRKKFGLRVYVGYLFHHDSALRSEAHVNQKIAQGARRIAAGEIDTVACGDLSVEKEFNYAGDVVEAMLTLMSQEVHFEAVLGSGREHSLAEWAELCFGLVGLNYCDHVVATPGFQPEFKRLVSNPSRLKSMGWRPQVDIARLAEIMVSGDDPGL